MKPYVRLALIVLMVLVFGLACQQETTTRARIDADVCGDAALCGDAASQTATDGDLGGDAFQSDDGSFADAGNVDATSDFALIASQECAEMKADWVFCDNFEHEDLDAFWDIADDGIAANIEQRKKTTLGDVVGAFGSNTQALYILPEAVASGSTGAGIHKTFDEDENRVMYARWYQKFDRNFDFTRRNHAGGGFWGGDRSFIGRSGYRTDGTYYSFRLEPNIYAPGFVNFYSYYRNMKMDCTDPNGACYGDNFPCYRDKLTYYCTNLSETQQYSFATVDNYIYPGDGKYYPQVAFPQVVNDQWYCIEVMLNAGDNFDGLAPDGIFNFWIDGIEAGPFEDLWVRTTSDAKVNRLNLGVYYHDAGPAAGIYFDNVVVSKSRIGCIGD